MTSQRGPEEHFGDAAVDAAWRATSTERPAPLSDAAILAAARAVTHSGAKVLPRRRSAAWRVLWQPLAAAAGVAGLAFLLVERLPTDASGPERMHAPPSAAAAPSAPARAPAAEAATSRSAADSSGIAPTTAEAPTAKGTATQPRREQPVDHAPAEGRAASLARQEAAAESTATASPPASPSAASPPLPESGPRESAERAADLAPAAAPPSAASAAAAPAAGFSTAKSQAAATAPEAWVHRIVELHASGNLAAAADELRAFRGAYSDADARLPGELRAWASNVAMDGAR